MKRIATTLTTLSASVLLGPTLGAAEPTLQALESRLGELESRIVAIEGALSGEQNSSYSYSDTAVIEATNASVATAPAAAVSAPSTTYVIRDGDTVGKIAEKHGIDRKALLEANRLSEGQPIYIGETLVVPGAIAAAPTPAPKPQAGSVAEANKPAPVKQDAIVVGDTKKPAASQPTATGTSGTKTHKVVKGDTLTSVAKTHSTTVESLKAANGLRTDTISLGQTLKIPGSQATTGQAASGSPASKPDQSGAFQYDNPLLKNTETYGYYTVAKGDNLYALAKDFFTTMPELQRINKLGSSTIIRPGDDLIVPTSKYNAYHKTGEMANN